MPIDTSSSQWKNGTEPSTFELRVLDFLIREPDKAHSPDEIADEIFDHPYSKVIELKRVLDSPDDEITEEDADFIQQFADARSDIKDAAERLNRLGLIETRVVEEPPIEVSYLDIGRCIVYTYAGRGDDSDDL